MDSNPYQHVAMANIYSDTPAVGTSESGVPKKGGDSELHSGREPKNTRLRDDRLCPSISYLISNARDNSEPTPKCFRISNVPLTWDEACLFDYLKSVDESLDRLATDDYRLSLYPACCGSSQVALLNFTYCPVYFRRLHPGQDHSLQRKDSDIVLDSHFYGLTPLNIPEGDIVADVVAVTGLAGHAYGSWRNRISNRMWLQDFLSCDVNNVRIMTYGYNTTLVGPSTGNDGMLEYRRNFICQLANARSSLEERNRPIIFLGHSLGGILILQALLQSNSQERHKNLLKATFAVFFFGTPHYGLRTLELEAMVDDMSSRAESNSMDLLYQLREGSEFLETQADGLADIWSQFCVVSFYETLKTPTVARSSITNEYGKYGQLADMVKKISAQLHLPNESRIPVQRNHSDMVKFLSPSDLVYMTVVRHLKECIDKIVKIRATTSTRRQALNEDGYKCLKSLGGSDSEGYRDDLLLKRHENTCVWFLSDERYRQWARQSHHSVLWVSGGPGCGKSVLSSVISKQFSDNTHKIFGREYLVAVFFCDDKDERLRTSHAILVNVLSQILKQEPDAFAHFSVESEYAIHKEKTSWSFSMLWRVFCRVVKDSKIRPVCLIVDALDECEELSREKFLNHLQDLVHDDLTIKQRIKLVLTSRPHIPITSHLSGVSEISLDAASLQNDITTFVTAEIDKLPQFTAMSEEIRDVLINGANGMFLWVSLILDNLRTSRTTKPRAIREKLRTLPPTLPDVYNEILRKIKPEDRQTANTILQWVVWAIRPLTLRELTIAIAVRPENTTMSTIEDEMELDMRTVLRFMFGPMIYIEDDNTVHLVHQSAKDFLQSDFTEKSNPNDQALPNWRLSSTESNNRLALICLTYLSFDEFDQGPVEEWEINEMLDYGEFLEYSAIHWPYHVRQTDLGNNTTHALSNAFRKLAKSRPKINLAYQVFRHSREESFFKTTPLQLAACCGFAYFVQELLDSGADVNEWGSPFSTALVAAASHGHESIVRLLIRHGAYVRARGDKALQEAASNGHVCVVRVLIENGADVHTSIVHHGSALQVAALNGHASVARLLLEYEADANSQGGYFGNALQAAARYGDESVVRLLIEHGADVNAQGGDCGNALQAAASNGHENVVRLLIEHKADVNAQGGFDRNALQAAIIYGQESVVRLLIDHEADVNIYTPGGMFDHTPLEEAAFFGRESIVRLLIDRKAEVNTPGNALQMAASYGHESVVHLLIEHGADFKAQGGYYGNSLQAAAHGGLERVVRFLIEHGANVHAQGGHFGNALQAAAFANPFQDEAEQGQDSVVRLLLLEHRVDVNVQGGHFGNALQAAACRGNKSLVCLLLEYGADVHAEGGYFGSALNAAALSGDESLVRLLIDREADVNAPGGYNGNPVQVAASKGHEGVVRLLIGRGADINAQCGHFGGALHAAAYGGHLGIVSLLIEHGADVNSHGGDYGNVLLAATCGGKKRIVRVLIEHGADMDAPCGRYGNTLQAAASMNLVYGVDLLLQEQARIRR